MDWPTTLPIPDAVLFDLDGVIVDSGPAHAAAWSALFAEQGVDFGPEDYERIAAGRPRDAVIREVLGNRPDHDRLMRRKAELMSDVPLATVPGTLPFLEALGLPHAIATSSRMPDFLLANAGLAGRFHTVVDRSQVEHGKPAPDLFLEAARRLGHAPAACVVIEDAPAGVEAGLAAGCTVIGLGDPGRLARAHVVVPRLPVAWAMQWRSRAG